MKVRQFNPPREARYDDKDYILNVIESHNEKWDKRIAKKYFDEFFKYPELFKKDKVYVLDEDKTIVGVVGYSHDKYESNNYWLGWFYIHSKCCNEGLGRQLLNFVKTELKKMKIKRLFVNTSSNEFYKATLLLYIQFGFKLEAIIKNYYEKNEDQLILSIDL